ncbi:hypothetical protein, partial [Desulfovibrio sp. DV]|uniref:hypothetical protein n=1 Tax=Desulfovibrio sp. DV TaxID=1844708 RepID=UPI001C3763E0
RQGMTVFRLPARRSVFRLSQLIRKALAQQLVKLRGLPSLFSGPVFREDKVGWHLRPAERWKGWGRLTLREAVSGNLLPLPVAPGTCSPYALFSRPRRRAQFPRRDAAGEAAPWPHGKATWFTVKRGQPAQPEKIAGQMRPAFSDSLRKRAQHEGALTPEDTGDAVVAAHFSGTAHRRFGRYDSSDD